MGDETLADTVGTAGVLELSCKILADRMEVVDFFGKGNLSTDGFRLKRLFNPNPEDPLELLGGTGLEERINGSGGLSLVGGGAELRKSSILSSCRFGLTTGSGVSTRSSNSSSESSIAYGSRGPRRLRGGIGGAASDGLLFSNRGARELVTELFEAGLADSARVLARDGDPEVTEVALLVDTVSIDISSSESIVFRKGATVRGMR